MDDQSLLKLSFILALVGISVLVVLADKLDLKNSNISEINENLLGNNIKIKGIVNPVRSNSVIQVLELQDNTGKITVVAYKSKAKIEKGSILEIEGQITKYNNELQVSAESIKILS